MKIEPKHLMIVNLALEQNPELAARLAEAIAALFPDNLIPAPGGAVLTGGVPALTPSAEKPQVPAKDAPTAPHGQEAMVTAIMGWFQKNHGKHRLNECRAALGVSQGSKPFKTALAHLQAEDLVKGSGKVGMGAEYWVTKKGEKWTPPVAAPVAAPQT